MRHRETEKYPLAEGSPAMRSKLGAVVVMLVLLVPTPVALGDESNPFQGAWVLSPDVDGSRNMLIVGGGKNHVLYHETGLSVCEFEFGEFVGGSVSGFATIEDDTLTFTGTLYCNLSSGRTASEILSDFEWVFNYHSSTDTVTLFDDPESEMTRPGS